MRITPFKALKPILPKTLFGRFFIILLVPLIAVQMVLGYIFFDRHTETILRGVSHTIAGDIALVAHMIEDNQPLKEVQALASTHLSLDITWRFGEILSQTGVHRSTWLNEHLAYALKAQIHDPFFIHMNKNVMTVDVQLSKGVVRIQTLRKRLFSKTTYLVVIWTTLSALLLFVVATLFMRNQIKPIRKLADAADRFGKGEDAAHFKPEGAQEVRIASQAFLNMKNRITRFMVDRTQQLACVSHDLRTPLARMKLQLALMPQNNATHALNEDVNDMTHMIQGFLDYARLSIEHDGDHDQRQEFIRSPIFLHTVLRQFARQIEKQYAGFVTLNLDQHDVSLSLNVHRINRVLTNLVLNSKQYASKVLISYVIDESNVILYVDDDGPGISSEKYDYVFQPFARLDASRNSKTGGTGLGLTIVRDIIHQHGGYVQLDQSPLGGLRVMINLPL